MGEVPLYFMLEVSGFGPGLNVPKRPHSRVKLMSRPLVEALGFMVYGLWFMVYGPCFVVCDLWLRV
jgi:hypothetical protein